MKDYEVKLNGGRSSASSSSPWSSSSNDAGFSSPRQNQGQYSAGYGYDNYGFTANYGGRQSPGFSSYGGRQSPTYDYGNVNNNNNNYYSSDYLGGGNDFQSAGYSNSSNAYYGF